MEKFKMVLTKVVTDDVTGAVVSEEVVAEEEYTGVAVLGECADGHMNEVVMHLSLGDIASMLASGTHTSVACKLANLMMDMTTDKAAAKENLLAALLMHGAKSATEKGE